MNRTLLTLCLLTCTGAAAAQQPLVLLDPARGGSESGARVADRVDEKTAALRLANRIAPLLRARGFAVEMTREADADVSSDARAALANNTHPIACILLHATGSGRGIHLYTTTLDQAAQEPGRPVLWDEAQSPYVDRSHALAEDLLAAFARAKLPASSGRTWLRPLDNMECPAVAVEVSPMRDGTTADDLTYQGHIADVIAGAMLAWRSRFAAMSPLPQAALPAQSAAPPPLPARTAP